ncbi:23S rRNA (pseudouridine(1915)-N(3))-methyltransferase RlmH [Roseibium sediminis]|uniref:23S rRNA (pseudouridine(1915)-N(3))-methyltransferase RlmH n=1 Tax=Roseibium sediminis TaxID=1775174 RepID=UPI00123C914B|nr:23S rRNA (pseudouridine(1915)-N(3))-methyltransferase RlmH [Roseibium sediminis]
MRLKIGCIGRLKAGAEKDLFDRYIDRARKAGRPIGVGDVTLLELPESRAGRAADRKREEAANLLSQLDARARLVVLDENGKSLSSESFSEKVFSWVDEGVGEIVFVIGGADGHGEEVLQRADLKLAMGAMTWPHQLVRILLTEQIYRAITIRSGHPYHRS